jgi:hypothetical protein
MCILRAPPSPSSPTTRVTSGPTLDLTISSLTSPSVCPCHLVLSQIWLILNATGGDWAGNDGVYASSGCPSTCVGESSCTHLLPRRPLTCVSRRLCQQQPCSVQQCLFPIQLSSGVPINLTRSFIMHRCVLQLAYLKIADLCYRIKDGDYTSARSNTRRLIYFGI